MPATVYGDATTAYERISRHSATEFNSGQCKQPPNVQRLYMPVRARKWNRYTSTAKAGWKGHPPPTAATTAVIGQTEAVIAGEFHHRVARILSEAMDPTGPYLWRQIGAPLPNWQPYVDHQESLGDKELQSNPTYPTYKRIPGGDYE